MASGTNREIIARSTPAGADLYNDLHEVDFTTSPIPSAILPGLFVTCIAALAAAFLAEHYHAPIMLLGLLIGLACNFLSADERLAAGLDFASKALLRFGIVLVGMQVTFTQIANLGWASFASIGGMMAIVILAGVLTARLTGSSAAFGALAGGAVAICGASAALALATVLGEQRVSKAQLTLVLVAISAASALAMSLYPALAHLLAMTDRQAGFFMGASIHDVAQALGAGYSYSADAGQMASITKLTRVALLAPVLAAVGFAFRTDKQSLAGIIPPWFVGGFLGMAAVNSVITVPPIIVSGLASIASGLLLMAVTATGIRSPLVLLLHQGWRASLPVVVATVVSLILAIVASTALF